MLFAKTVCKPSSYVEVIPCGLQLRLQYNKNGIIEKACVGVDDNDESALDIKAFKQLHSFVPTTIPLSGGTTWVYGVLYTDSIPYTPGNISTDLNDAYIEMILNGVQFKFYAGHVHSLASSFNGSLAIRNWLALAKFNVLPGIVVPIDMSEQTLKMMMDTNNFNFNYPYISGYFVYEGLNYKYVPSGLTQCTVKSVTKIVDQSGYIKGEIKTDYETLKLMYSEVVSNNIQTATSLLYYKEDSLHILATRKTDNKRRDKLPSKLTCSVCKKQFNVPSSGPVRCDDEHCLSRQYPEVTNILRVLELPSMSFEDYKKAVKNDEITTSTDVFLLDAYKDLKPEASLSQILRAATPIEVCADSSFFDKLASACNNSVETLLYYMNNPQRLNTELDIASLAGKRFIDWISDAYNALTLSTLLTFVNVRTRKPSFEGAPIFRGNKFVITGLFKRGNYDKIASILESYAGKVIPDMNEELPSAVIVGSTNEGISGSIIKKARVHNIPILEEDGFFTQYEIDNDIASANLL